MVKINSKKKSLRNMDGSIIKLEHALVCDVIKAQAIDYDLTLGNEVCKWMRLS